MRLYLAIGVPTAFNAILVSVCKRVIDKRMDGHFASMNQRFDEMRDLWQAELHRGGRSAGCTPEPIEEERG
jgi:hypothetical protein